MIIYTCPSNLNFVPPPDGKHQARLEDTVWTCTCDGHRYGYTCIHIKKARELVCGKYWEAVTIGVGPTEPGRCECGQELSPIEVFDYYEDDISIINQTFL